MALPFKEGGEGRAGKGRGREKRGGEGKKKGLGNYSRLKESEELKRKN